MGTRIRAAVASAAAWALNIETAPPSAGPPNASLRSRPAGCFLWCLRLGFASAAGPSPLELQGCRPPCSRTPSAGVTRTAVEEVVDSDLGDYLTEKQVRHHYQTTGNPEAAERVICCGARLEHEVLGALYRVPAIKDGQKNTAAASSSTEQHRATPPPYRQVLGLWHAQPRSTWQGSGPRARGRKLDRGIACLSFRPLLPPFVVLLSS